MIVQYCQIHLCHICKDCNKNNRAALSCCVNGLVDRNVVSCAIIDYIRFIASKTFHKNIIEISIPGINGVICAAVFRQSKAIVGYIGNQNLLCTHTSGNLRHQITNWPRAKNSDFFPRNIAKSPNSVYCNGQRLDHGSLFIGQCGRKQCYFR